MTHPHKLCILHHIPQKYENTPMELVVDDDMFAIIEVNLYKHNHS